jgi:uncharacterized SAM-binding protein YcdF (DUF218 family)
VARRHSFSPIPLVLGLVLLCAATVAFRGAGRWLVREDRLGPADEIVVLSGGLPARAEEAAEIFRGGYAHAVWVSRPASPGPELAAMGIAYTGEQDYSRDVLVQRGVPQADIQIFPHEINNTEQEVEEISALLARDQKTTAIVVTSAGHTRRVRALWQRLAGKNQRLIVRGAPQERVDLDHWWRNTHDTLAVVREMLGLVNVWTGLGVRPPGQ